MWGVGFMARHRFSTSLILAPAPGLCLSRCAHRNTTITLTKVGGVSRRLTVGRRVPFLPKMQS